MPAPSSSTPLPPWLYATLVLIGVLALMAPAWVVTHPPHIARSPDLRVIAPHRVVSAAELPPVEPMQFQTLTPQDARAWNASVPFVPGPIPAARPLRIAGTGEDRERAIDCLAAAMLYEAGDDPVGERAVGQVVINRARHPAFPKTICGVVFQGSERTTGCQFTFTCDGSIARAPDPVRWARARKLAEAALAGGVVPTVGLATHYHTDWVVPYWSASLDKVAEVHTHLFFRWTGWWGTPGAFQRAIASTEPAIPQLAAWSPAHAMGSAIDEAAIATAAAAQVMAVEPGAIASQEGTFLIKLDPKLSPDQFPALATAACGPRDYCKLLAWRDAKDKPKALPATPDQMAAMAFSYLRDRAKGFDKPLWNCGIFKRADSHQCMKVQFVPSLKPVVSGPTDARSPEPSKTPPPPLKS